MSNSSEHTAFDIETPPEPGSMRLIMTLAIAGLISGIVLVGTFIITDPLIKANKEAAIQRAIFKVLPDCQTTVTLKLQDNKLVEKIPEPGKKETDKDELVVYAGFNDQQELVGFAIPGAGAGFQDIISTIFGYNASKKIIIGFEVLESKETPGLGDKIFKDTDFQTNFTSLAVEPKIMAVKKGEKTQANEVEAITGATISSKAVVKLLNNTVSTWKEPIDNYIRDNNLTISKKDE